MAWWWASCIPRAAYIPAGQRYMNFEYILSQSDLVISNDDPYFTGARGSNRACWGSERWAVPRDGPCQFWKEAVRSAGCGPRRLPGQPHYCEAPAPDIARLPLARASQCCSNCIWRARSRPARPPRRCPKTAADPRRKPPALCWTRRRQPRTHFLVAAALRSTTTTAGIARDAHQHC